MEKENFDYSNFRFEFLLSVNDNIICQRLFDVRGYNSNVLKSYDLKWLVDDCVSTINKNLKETSKELMWKYYNPYIEQTQESVDSSKYTADKEYVFNFTILVDGKPVVSRIFDGQYYSPSAFLKFNIKDVIPDIINQIRNTFSRRKFQKKYGEVEL